MLGTLFYNTVMIKQTLIFIIENIGIIFLIAVIVGTVPQTVILTVYLDISSCRSYKVIYFLCSIVVSVNVDISVKLIILTVSISYKVVYYNKTCTVCQRYIIMVNGDRDRSSIDLDIITNGVFGIVVCYLIFGNVIVYTVNINYFEI